MFITYCKPSASGSMSNEQELKQCLNGLQIRAAETTRKIHLLLVDCSLVKKPA